MRKHFSGSLRQPVPFLFCLHSCVAVGKPAALDLGVFTQTWVGVGVSRGAVGKHSQGVLRTECGEAVLCKWEHSCRLAEFFVGHQLFGQVSQFRPW